MSGVPVAANADAADDDDDDDDDDDCLCVGCVRKDGGSSPVPR